MSTNKFPSSNPLVLGSDDSPNGKAQTPKPVQTKTAPASNPLVLGADDNQYVKKKDGTSDSSIGSSPTVSPLESPSPVDIDAATKAYQNKQFTENDFNVLAQTDGGKQLGLNSIPKDAVPAYIHSVNSTTRKDLVDNVMNNVINQFYPASQEPAKNKARQEIMKGVLIGSQDDIAKVKSNVVQNLNQQINEINNQAGVSQLTPLGPAYQYNPVQQQKVDAIKNQIKTVSETMDAWGINQIVNSPEMKPFLDMDANHPQIFTSVAASKIGEEIKKRYGISGNSGNQAYDVAQAGMQSIIQNKKMMASEQLKNGLPSKNPEVLKQAQQNVNDVARYTNWYNNLDTEQFPDVGLTKTIRFLGDIIAENKPSPIKNNIGIITSSDVAEAVKIAEQQNPGWYNKYVKFVSTIQENTSAIPHPGLFGALERGMAEQGANLVKIATTLNPQTIGYNQDTKDIKEQLQAPVFKGTSQSGGTPTKIVYDKAGKAYRESENEHYNQIDWNNSMRFLGESLPGLAAWIAPETAGAEVAAGLGAGKKLSRTAGLVAASYVNGFDGNRRLADELIDDNSSLGDAKKNIYANLMTLTTAGVFKMLDYSPTKAIEAAISKNAGPDLVKMLAENDFQGITSDQAQSFIKDQLIPRVQAVAEKFGENLKSGAKMGAATVADSKIKDFANIITNPDKAKTSSSQDNIREMGTQTLLMTIVGLPGMVASGAMPHSSKDALYDIGLRSPQYIDRINDMVSKGELDQDKANLAIATANTAAQEVFKVQHEVNDDGLPLTVSQKKQIVAENIRERSAAMMKDKGIEIPASGRSSETNPDAKTVKAENKYQPIEDTKTFQSISEDETGQKPKSISDIDISKNYTYSKEGQLVTENGASLINHLFNGKIEDAKVDPETEGKTTELPTQEPTMAEKAQVVVESAIVSDEIKGTSQESAKQDPVKFLKEVSDQAHGITADGLKSDVPNAEKAARENYGDSVVDAAKEMFPAPEVKEPEPVFRTPEEKEKLTDQKISKEQGRIQIDKGNGKTKRADLEVDTLKNRHARLENVLQDIIDNKCA